MMRKISENKQFTKCVIFAQCKMYKKYSQYVVWNRDTAIISKIVLSEAFLDVWYVNVFVSHCNVRSLGASC